MTKPCKICKDASLSIRRGKNGWSCNSCYLEINRNSHKKYYKPEKESIRNSIRKGNSRNFVRKLKSYPCSDCKVIYPFYVMDFDHKPDGSKSFNISTALSSGYTIDRIKKEVQKCDLVCSNCHRERTYSRKYKKAPVCGDSPEAY